MERGHAGLKLEAFWLIEARYDTVRAADQVVKVGVVAPTLLEAATMADDACKTARPKAISVEVRSITRVVNAVAVGITTKGG